MSEFKEKSKNTPKDYMYLGCIIFLTLIIVGLFWYISCIGKYGYYGGSQKYYKSNSDKIQISQNTPSSKNTMENSKENFKANIEDLSLENLESEQRYIVEISSFAAQGDMEQLRISLESGLDNGLSVNQIKEVLLHIYAYAGFPRSLNALGVFQSLLADRSEEGIEDELGEDPTPVSGNIDKYALGAEVQTGLVGMSFNYEFSEGMDSFLKEHLFADLFERGVLTYQERELTTIAVLASLDGVESQLGSHINMGMNTGLNFEQIRDILEITAVTSGKNRSEILNRFNQQEGENNPEE